MVPKPSSKSKATSFNGTLKFWVSKKKLEKFQLFQKNSAHKGLRTFKPESHEKIRTTMAQPKFTCSYKKACIFVLSLPSLFSYIT